MQTSHRNLKIQKGISFSELYRFIIDETTGDRFDLTLYGVRLMIRTTKKGGSSVWDSDDTLPSSSIETGADPTTGEITLTIGADVTVDFPVGAHYYDMELYLLADMAKVTTDRPFMGRVFVFDDNVEA